MDLYTRELLKCEPEGVVKLEQFFFSYDVITVNNDLANTQCEPVSFSSSNCRSLNDDIIKQESKSFFSMRNQDATFLPTTMSTSVNQAVAASERSQENTGNLIVTSNRTNENLPIDTPTQNEDHKVLDFDVEPLNSMRAESEQEPETDCQPTLEISMEYKKEPCENRTKKDSDALICKKELKVILKDFLVDRHSNSKIVLKDLTILLENNLRETESTNCKNRRTKNSASCIQTRKPKTRMKTRHRHSKKNPDFLVENFDKTYFTCDRYKFKSSFSRSFKTHMIIHDEFVDTNIYKCNNCDYESFQLRHLRVHMQEKHSNGKQAYRCRFCNKKLNNTMNLADHLLCYHGDKFDKSLKTLLGRNIQRCKLCDFRTTTTCKLDPHITKHSDSSVPREIFKCNNCLFITCNKSCLQVHIQRKHSNNRPTYSCRCCNKTLFNKKSLADHLLCHHGDKFDKSLKTILSLTINDCNYCDFKTISKSKLDEHMTKHGQNVSVDDRKILRCSRKSSLRFHNQTKHSNDTPTYSCRFCNKTLSKKESLANHLLVLHGDKFDKSLKTLLSLSINHCNYCDFKTVSKTTLDEHMIKHGQNMPGKGRKILKCSNCVYETRMKSHLRTHIQAKHSNDRPTYSCRFCNKTLFRKESLANHLLRLHGDKFDKSLKTLLSHSIKHCNYCDFKAISNTKLNQHMAKHSIDRRTYSCSFCNKALFKKESLANHLLAHHGDKFDKSLKTILSMTIKHCKVCDFRTTGKSKLTRHMASHDK